ncbi:unnamed protein product, partial [Ostreobium quekettii]
MRPPATALAWALVALAWAGTALGQESDRTDNSFLEAIPIEGLNASRIDVLAAGEGVTGTLPFNLYDVFAFQAPEREEEGLGFPDILLSLDVLNDATGGNADIYCWPLLQENGNVVLPTREKFHWASNHSQGTDLVFISSNDSFYGEGVSNNFTREDGHTISVGFVCSVIGQSVVPSEYRLELELDYTKRSLVSREVSAMRSIFNKCCRDSGCPRWLAMSSEVVGWNASGEETEPVLDMCHLNLNGSVCNDDGRLLKLNLDLFELECAFPFDELKVMSQLQKVSLDYNRLTGDIGAIAGGLK